MKRKNKIIEKIKRFLPLLLAVILSGSMIFGLWLFSRSKGVNTVSASAEMSSPESTSNYFNSFLFPDKTEKNGGALYRTSDGAFIIDGTFTHRTAFQMVVPNSSLSFSAFETLLGRTVYTWCSSSVGTSYSTVYAEIEYTVDGVLKYGANTMGTQADLASGKLTYLKFVVIVNAGTYERDFLYVSVYRNAQSNFYTPSVIGVYEKGYNEGYDQGYADITAETKELYRTQAEQAVLEDKETFLEGIFAIVDAPLNVIRNAFNFEILGFNVADLLFFVLTLILFVFVIRKLKGG